MIPTPTLPLNPPQPAPRPALRLGDLELPSRYWLSPLAGYTNLPFRLCRSGRKPHRRFDRSRRDIGDRRIFLWTGRQIVIGLATDPDPILVKRV